MLRQIVSILLIASWLSACQRHEPRPTPQSDVDVHLRTFLGIRTLRGTFTLPTTAKGYYPVAVMFADGKEVAQAILPLIGLSSQPQSAFSGEIQLLSPSDSKLSRRAALVDGLNQRDLTELYPHWDEFSSAAWRSVPDDENLQYKGISIRGILAGSPGTKTHPALYPTGDNLATVGKYVVAIGVVYDSDYTALRAKFDSQNR